MPWKSKAQAAWGNSPAGHKALGDKGVSEWNRASKGMSLPEHTGHVHHEDHSSSYKTDHHKPMERHK